MGVALPTILVLGDVDWKHTRLIILVDEDDYRQSCVLYYTRKGKPGSKISRQRGRSKGARANNRPRALTAKERKRSIANALNQNSRSSTR
jgi:hypothetical protein